MKCNDVINLKKNYANYKSIKFVFITDKILCNIRIPPHSFNFSDCVSYVESVHHATVNKKLKEREQTPSSFFACYFGHVYRRQNTEYTATDATNKSSNKE